MMASLDWRSLENRLRGSGILNRNLQDICGRENLSKSGVKTALQNRILERVKQYANAQNHEGFNRLKWMIENPHSMDAMPGGRPGFGVMNSASPAISAPMPLPTPAPPAMNNGYVNGYNNAGMNGYRPNAPAGRNVSFKPSPFFKWEKKLGETKECPAMTAHRHSVEVELRVGDHPILSKIPEDPSLRVMVFCAVEGHGEQDITFPHQSELKVNGGDIKANLRGLKNKPGSTRPVDITKELRLNIPHYANKVEMTYALTAKASGNPPPPPQKHYMVLWAVRAVPVADLVIQLQTGRKITKESVVSEMLRQARDPDIVATASVLSLKCPLSTLRMELPCRSISCRHNQCFDGTSYLQLQEQGPTWLCPICNVSAPFANLAVDEYVKDILKNTSRSVDQVTVQPEGKWELMNKRDPAKLDGVASTSDDDEDLVEVTKSGDSVKMGAPRASATPVLQRATPSQPSLSRPQGSASATPDAPRGPASTSSKRPIAAVIDLTSSGDEDEEPIERAPKRQFSGTGFQNFTHPLPYKPAPGSNNAAYRSQ